MLFSENKLAFHFNVLGVVLIVTFWFIDNSYVHCSYHSQCISVMSILSENVN